jgi:ABC-type branched-subunit amino acid transport system ATPase component
MLEVKDINLFYGAAQALRGVSISAEPGKVTCVLGRNIRSRPARSGSTAPTSPD